MFKWLFKKKGCAKHMNNKLEVIGIDHGWSMMKTISQVFVTGVKEITTTPALFGDVLEYEGKFYKVGTVRQEVKDTKVEDDSFYLLTLAAVAKELKRRGLAEAKVFLAVGLPLTRFGAEKNDFIKYLTKNKRVSFKYENEPYYIEIDDVAVFPQCYAAVVDKIPTMAKKTLIVDIGSWTIDIMPVRQLLLGTDENRIDEVLQIVSLTNTGKKKAGQFSLGMKQRLGIAMALLGEPELLILDEPTNGLDPIGIEELRELIRSFPEQGITVILSSHILSEVQLLADKVGIISGGILGYEGALKQGDNLEDLFMNVVRKNQKAGEIHG